MLRCTYLHDGVLTLYQNKILLYSGLASLSSIPFCDMVTLCPPPYNWEGRVTVGTVHVSVTLSKRPCEWAGMCNFACWVIFHAFVVVC